MIVDPSVKREVLALMERTLLLAQEAVQAHEAQRDDPGDRVLKAQRDHKLEQARAAHRELGERLERLEEMERLAQQARLGRAGQSGQPGSPGPAGTDWAARGRRPDRATRTRRDAGAGRRRLRPAGVHMAGRRHSPADPARPGSVHHRLRPIREV